MKIKAEVCEAECSSTSVEDTSPEETKMEFGVEDEVSNYYFWNHFSPRELNGKGMSLQEAYLMLSSKFDDD